MEVTRNNLSPKRRRLIESMRRIHYGRILNLDIRDGEPSFTALTRIERQIKFGGEEPVRPDATQNDFVLKSKVIELLACIGRMQDGTITQLEIKGGLPFAMTVEERVS